MIGIHEGIWEELGILRDACALGILLAFGYDLLRILRRIVPHGTIGISVEDILFWAACGVVIFLLLYEENDGYIRGYILGQIVLGALIYRLLLGRFLMKWISVGIRWTKKQLKKAAKTFTMFLRKHLGK